MTVTNRILAFDVGEKRIGLAVSDPLGITAQGLETFYRTGDEDKDIDELLKIAARYDPCVLLFGIPKNMDGSIGFQAEYVQNFAEKMGSMCNYRIEFCDERLTTVAAHRIITDSKSGRKRRKEIVDTVAATLILQTYLDMGGLKT